MSTHIALRIAEDVTARHYPGVDIHSASRAANVCDARGAALVGCPCRPAAAPVPSWNASSL